MTKSYISLTPHSSHSITVARLLILMSMDIIKHDNHGKQNKTQWCITAQH